MGRRWMGWMAGAALAWPLAGHGQVDLAGLDRDMAGPRAQVLVLASVHLSELPHGVAPGALDGLLDRLVAFRPDIITIEHLPGEECDFAARHPARYDGDYCPDTAAARAATGLDIPGAIAEVDRTLEGWPAQPTPAQRRRLAALFMAANDRASAYVQWLQLPEAERRAGDGLDEALLDALRQLGTRDSESYRIAASLAARLGLQRLHAIDNHTGDNARINDVRAFGRAVEQAWKTGSAQLDARLERQAPLAGAADLLPLYRFVNDPEHLRVLAESNIVPSVRASSPEDYPLVWVAGWETRNLRMVANIRESFRERPRARVLSIVGASHKPWFDSWLGQLQGVEIVDALEVLE